MKIEDLKEVVVNGETLPVDELSKRVITVKGVQPSNFEQWQFIDVLVDLRNKKEGAGGVAQAIYRYSDLADLDKFHEHAYPYKLSVLMAESVDKKGNVVQEIVYADFANVVELELVPRKPVLKSASNNNNK